MADIQIIVDSGCDFPKEELERMGVDIVPLTITFGEKSYQDYTEIDTQRFVKLCNASKEAPHTAMPSIPDISDKMRPHLEAGKEVLMITMSAKGSGTHGAALNAKRELEEEFGRELPITVVDSNSFTLGYLYLVYDAVEMAKNGKTREEIVAYLEEKLPLQRLLFVVGDISYLKKGGRIKPGAAVIGGILGVVPILEVKDGLAQPIAKERGRKKALEAIVKIVEKECPSGKIKRMGITRCNCDKDTEELKRMLMGKFEVENFMPFVNAMGTILTHGGPEFFAVTYEREV